MPKTAANPNYAQYAGYGSHGYHPGLDDPSVLTYPYYQPTPQPDKTPDWAVPSALIASGLLGAVGLKGLGRLAARKGKGLLKKTPATAPAAPSAPVAAATPKTSINPEYTRELADKGLAIKMSSVIALLGRIARQTP